MENLTPSAFMCDKCPKVFSYIEILKSHERYHEIDEQKCDSCDKICKNKLDLQMHQRVHTKTSKTNIYKCPACSKVFANQNSFIIHKKNHLPRKFSCDVCSKLFVRKSQWEAHLPKCGEEKENPRKNNKAISCAECLEYFESKSALKEHKKIHKNVPICDI